MPRRRAALPAASPALRPGSGLSGARAAEAGPRGAALRRGAGAAEAEAAAGAASAVFKVRCSVKNFRPLAARKTNDCVFVYFV